MVQSSVLPDWTCAKLHLEQTLPMGKVMHVYAQRGMHGTHMRNKSLLRACVISLSFQSIFWFWEFIGLKIEECKMLCPVLAALSRWHVHSLPSGSSRAHVHRMGLDIVDLNREGVKLGLVSAKEHYHYQATQFCRRCVPAPGPRRPPPTRFPLDTTFGISTRWAGAPW